MYKQHIIKMLSALALVLVTLGACNRIEDNIPLPCTYLADPECFCDRFPDHPLCSATIDCTFEADPDCFCTANPNDPQCDLSSGGSEIQGSIFTYFDHFEGQNADTVFESGFLPDNPQGWQERADPNARIQSGDAAIGEDYLAVEIEVLEAGWAWTSNLFYDWMERTGSPFDAGSDPYFNFYIRTVDGVPFQFEGAFGDADGESGFHFKFDGSSDWQFYSLRMSTLDWKWGSGANMNALNYFKLGFNVDGFEAGAIPEVHMDGVYLSASPAAGATVIDQANANLYHTYFDFEAVDDISAIFSSGYIPDNPDGWQEKGSINATVKSGDAAKGDQFLELEIEVIDEGWAWLGNLFSSEVLDISVVSDPHLNFYIRTADGGPFQIESAFADPANGESGFNIDKSLINGEWKLISVKMDAINWQWGGTLDYSQLNLFKFGFNQDGYVNGDIITVHVDDFTITSGPANGADEVVEQM